MGSGAAGKMPKFKNRKAYKRRIDMLLKSTQISDQIRIGGKRKIGAHEGKGPIDASALRLFTEIAGAQSTAAWRPPVFARTLAGAGSPGARNALGRGA